MATMKDNCEASFNDIYQALREEATYNINSAQTARNIYLNAIKKIKFLIQNSEKYDLLREFIAQNESSCRGDFCDNE